MSIRSTKFVNEIIPLWKEIESLLKDINVKGLSTDDRNEIAHSKKVVAYFSGMLDAIDPDFIPMQVLVNVISPITYILVILRILIIITWILYLEILCLSFFTKETLVEF